MDTELVDSIRLCVKNMNTVTELDKDKSHKLLTRVSTAFISDPTKHWWWESLSCKSDTIVYGDNDGLEIIKKNLKDDCPVFLVVTDDECAPWQVFHGHLDEIL